MATNIHKTIAILKNAYCLIEDADHWIKGAYFNTHEDTDGEVVNCYCAVGAVRYAYMLSDDKNSADFIQALDFVRSAIPSKQMPRYEDARQQSEQIILNWNDEQARTHDDVILTMARAIDNATREARRMITPGELG